jgi:hypothetical protein
MCASHSVLFRLERRNESKFAKLRSSFSYSSRVTVGRSNSPPISLIDDMAEL